jgi:hypothetical protein
MQKSRNESVKIPRAKECSENPYNDVPIMVNRGLWVENRGPTIILQGMTQQINSKNDKGMLQIVVNIQI